MNAARQLHVGQQRLISRVPCAAASIDSTLRWLVTFCTLPVVTSAAIVLFNIVVLDVELCDRGQGIEMLRHVVRAQPHIQGVVLSNFHWAAMRNVNIDAGACAYFDKLMQFMQVKDYIAALLPRHVGTAVC